MSQQADFSALAEAYADDLYRFAFWLCRDPHNAEDLVQETLLRAWRGFAGLRDLDAAKSWLLTTLRREHYRRKPQADVRSLDDEEKDYGIEALAEMPRLDDKLDVAQRLDALPVAYREVLVLQLLFGYSTQEIAGLIDATAPAVANRLLRARRALQQAGSSRVVPLRRKAP